MSDLQNRLESEEYLKWDDEKQMLVLCAKVLGSYSRRNMSEAVVLSAVSEIDLYWATSVYWCVQLVNLYFGITFDSVLKFLYSLFGLFF